MVCAGVSTLAFRQFYKNIRRPFIDKMGVLTYNFKQIVPPW